MSEKPVAFSVRLPKQLVDALDARSQSNHRSRSAEVLFLLENLLAVKVSGQTGTSESPQRSGPADLPQ